MMSRAGSIIILLLCVLAQPAMAQRTQVRKGNDLYQQKKYKEAAAAYQQALTKNPVFTPGIFNLGNALYQQKNFDASRKAMNAAAKNTTDKQVKGNASYNIGNTYMAEQKWEEAINAYKEALRLNPNDEAAKYNLSYARAMMKKNQGGGDKNNQDKNKDQQNKDQNQKDNKEQNKDQQNKDQQNQDKEKQQDKKDQQQDQKDEQQDQNQQKNQDDQRPQPQPSKLSKEQADQLLDALAQEEKKLHDKKEKGKAVKIKMDKDW